MDEFISLSYGSGGKKTSRLIDEILLPALSNSSLSQLGDGALLKVSEDIAFSTDSYVIDPYIFPGGNIGKLSVCGTVNDLLMCGSIPKYLSLSLIIEEGFPTEKLKEVIDSVSIMAKASGVQIVTGDTKVVDRGHGHGIFINTAGIGERVKGISYGKENIRTGDMVILSGSCGNHGVSILNAREKLIETEILSDCAVLMEAAEVMFHYGNKVRILRDPTRGGVATTLNEFTENTPYTIEIQEDKVPVDGEIRTACELLGLDPLYSANEGKFLAIVDPGIAFEAVEALRKLGICKNASVIGEVTELMPSKVLIKGVLGGRRILDKLSYDMLPRIC
ncbi:MAG: hydrogenase expression/formation protein HypE [Bacillota bacterium]|nr:hydrogenase expression/formation protein HypE [Bacillota bacterium]